MKFRFNTRTVVMWALILTGLTFFVTVLTSEMSYLTNDDGSIQSTLSGFLTGEPYSYHQFISVILSFPIAGLYRIFPGTQWWYVWSMLAMAVGIFVVQYCLLRIACKSNHPMIITFGILVFLDVGFFIYPLANVSFTIVPAILGTGLVVWLFWMAAKDHIKHKRWAFFGITIGYILVLSHRRQTGLVILCYILLAFLYYYVNKSEDRKKAVLKYIGTAGLFILLTVVLTTFNDYVQDNHNGEDFVEFNIARNQFMDYPHDTYEENPGLYEEVDWDEDTYNLVTQWCFLNENVTAESLSYVSENSIHTTTSTNIITALKQIYHDGKSLALFVLYAASIVIAGFFIITNFNSKILIFFLINNGGTWILLIYQILSGRALYRSIIIVLLPAVVINLFLGLQNNIGGRSKWVFHVGLLMLGLICIVPTMYAICDEERQDYVKKEKEKYTIVDEYLAKHQTDFYVREITGVIDDIFPEHMSNRLSNSIGWGGSSWYSKIYYDQLEIHGLSELTEETFKQENIYFISKMNVMDESYYEKSSDSFSILYEKLKEDCGALGFVQEDVITDGVYVYHFVFEGNAMIYDSYYDIVDGYTIKRK